MRRAFRLAIIFAFLIGEFFITQNLYAVDDDIIINEIGAYELNGNEWIEIWNRGSSTIDLTDWKFWEDNTNHKLSVSSTDFFMSAGEYGAIVQDEEKFKTNYPLFSGSIFDSSWGNLNESGEEIGLKNSSGDFVEQFTYIEATNNSLERKDPFLLDYTTRNWAEHSSANSLGIQNSVYQTNTSTQQQVNTSTSNQVSTSTPEQTNTSTPIISSTIYLWPFIKINEFVSDPQDGNEWVELYNNSTSSFDLVGGSICDNRLTGCKMVSGTVAGLGWLVIDLQTKSFLNNNGDSVILIDPDDDIIDRVDYGDNFIPSKGQSLARKSDGQDNDSINDWAVTTQITKQAKNVIVAPVVPTSGGGKTMNDTPLTPLEGGVDITSTSTRDITTTTSSTIPTTGKVIITELLPNPIGQDAKGEYIRITNLSSSTINLVGWKLADLAKSFKLSGIINSGESIVWLRASTSIALNNTKSEVVSLLDSQGNLLDKVGYNKASEDMVYRRYGEEWKWEKLSLEFGIGGSNVEIINELADEAEEVISKTSVKKTNIIKVAKITTPVVYSFFNKTLLEARESTKGEKVKVVGVVSVLPGVFGSQYLYISDQTSGIQIYSYKKDFPALAVGDKIEVIGEISSAYGINRVKITNKDDIDVLATNQTININSSSLSDLSEMNLGGLVKISGLITELKSTYMYVDDGSDEIKVYFKSGANINKASFKEGKNVEVVGILEISSDSWQLQPRNQQDIKIMGDSEYLINQNQVLKSDPNTSKESTSKYLETTAGGLGAIILGFLIRARGALALGGIKKAALMAARIIRRG